MTKIRIRIEEFRDEHGRLRAKLFINGRVVSVKPAERVSDGAPIGQRHHYNLLKVFGLGSLPLSKEQRIRLLAGEEVEVEI